jgi:hypothetical protein
VDETLFWLIPLVVVIGLLAGALLRPSRSRAPRGLPGPVTEGTLERARALIAQDKPILAIKGVREETGLGLAEAKQLVDALRQGRPVPTTAVPGAQTVPLADRVRDLRAQDRMIDAIALVVAETGMTEAEATRFVDTLD